MQHERETLAALINARNQAVSPKLKQSRVDACAHMVLVDQQGTDREAELLRAILIALGYPMPPFLKVLAYNLFPCRLELPNQARSRVGGDMGDHRHQQVPSHERTQRQNQADT